MPQICLIIIHTSYILHNYSAISIDWFVGTQVPCVRFAAYTFGMAHARPAHIKHLIINKLTHKVAEYLPFSENRKPEVK